MKPSEYVDSFVSNGKFLNKEFISEFSEEFLAFLERFKADDNIKGFDAAVRVMRMKFDAIKSRCPLIEEKVWKFFFATKVVRLREILCGKEHAHRVKIKEEKRRRWEEKKQYEKEWTNYWQREQSNYWDRLFNSLIDKQINCPIDSFHYLELSESVSIDDVKKRYKQLSMKHHPDLGGDSELFIKITKEKNKCIHYLTNKT